MSHNHWLLLTREFLLLFHTFLPGIKQLKMDLSQLSCWLRSRAWLSDAAILAILVGLSSAEVTVISAVTPILCCVLFLIMYITIIICIGFALIPHIGHHTISLYCSWGPHKLTILMNLHKFSEKSLSLYSWLWIHHTLPTTFPFLHLHNNFLTEAALFSPIVLLEQFKFGFLKNYSNWYETA